MAAGRGYGPAGGTESLRRTMEVSPIRQAAEWLRKGSLVIVPTDTVYGLAAQPDLPGAVERLCQAKGRDRAKPIPLLAATMSDVERCGAVFGPASRALAERFWPGPLTLVLRVRGGGFCAGCRSGSRRRRQHRGPADG